MKDANLALRSVDTDLEATANGTGVDFGGADNGPVTYELNVEAFGGTNPTLAVKIQESADNSTFNDFLSFESITALGQYFVTGQSDKRYRRVVFTVGGTDPNFGAVHCHPTFAGRYQKI